MCTITKLPKGGEETIKVKSRIWNSTLVEDYSNVDWVEIYSRAHITIPDPTITQSTVSDDAASVSFSFYKLYLWITLLNISQHMLLPSRIDISLINVLLKLYL